MSDFRDPNYRDPLYRDPNDPLGRMDLPPDGARSNAGWIGAGVFVIVLVALLFGLSRTGTETAITDMAPPPAATGPAPPTTTGSAPPTMPTPRTTTGEGSK